MLMSLISTNEAAERLGITRRRIVALILDGRLTAQKVGRDYVIDEKDLKLVEDRKPGRPPKAAAAKAESGRKTRKRNK